jgi:hypothetical protein
VVVKLTSGNLGGHPIIIIMLPNQAIASTPSAPRPSGAEGRGSTAPLCLEDTPYKKRRYHMSCILEIHQYSMQGAYGHSMLIVKNIAMTTAHIHGTAGHSFSASSYLLMNCNHVKE